MSPMRGRSISMVAALGCATALYQGFYRSAAGLAILSGVALFSIREASPPKKGSTPPLRKSPSSPALLEHSQKEVALTPICPLQIGSVGPSVQSLAVAKPPLPIAEVSFRRLKLSAIPQKKSSRWLSLFKAKVAPSLESPPQIIDGVLWPGKEGHLLLNWDSIFDPSLPLSFILSFEPAPQFAFTCATERAGKGMGSLLATFFPVQFRVDSLARPLVIARGISQLLSPNALPRRRIQQIEIRFPEKNESIPGWVRDMIFNHVIKWFVFFNIAVALRTHGELRLIFSEDDFAIGRRCQEEIFECNKNHRVLEFLRPEGHREEGKGAIQRHLVFRALPLPEEVVR